MATLTRIRGPVPGRLLLLAVGVVAWLVVGQWSIGQDQEPPGSRFGNAAGEGLEEILSIAVDPSNSQVVYAGTSGFGLVKSVDGGRSWSSVGSELEALTVTSVAIHPRTSQVVYAGTAAAGMWLSISAAMTFEHSSIGLPSPQVHDVLIDRERPLVVYAGTSRGLARSDNAGRLWQQAGRLTAVRDLELGGVLEDESRDQRVAAPSRRFRELWALTENGLWYSDTQGRFFSPRLEASRMESLARASGENDETSAADQVEAERPLAVAPELDPAGEAEQRGETDFEQGDQASEQLGDAVTDSGSLEDDEKLSVKVAAADPSVIYVASGRLGLFRSRDGGFSWRHLPQIGGVRSLAVDAYYSDRLWAGTDQGIWRSLDGGQTFTQVEQGSELSVEALALDPRHPERVYAVVPGGRLLIRADDGGWSLVGLRAGQLTLGDQIGAGRGADRLDRLPARPLGDPGLGPNVNVAIHALVADRRFPHVIYAATGRGVYRSEDAGATWSARRHGLGELEVTALAVESADSYARFPVEDATLLAGTAGAGIYLSSSSGRRFDASSRGLDDPHVRALLIDPHDAELAWAGTANGGIFRSQDGGLTWRSSSDGLVEFGIRDLDAAGGDLFAATDLGGVYRSADLGSSWRRLGTVGLAEPKDRWVERLSPWGIDPRLLGVSALAVHDGDGDHLAAATALGIFTSVDSGATWRWAGRFLNSSDITYDSRQDDFMAAATSRGLARSADGGLTWQLEQDSERTAVVSVAILEAGEAAGAVLAGTDDGRILRRRQGKDEPALGDVGLPWRAAPSPPLLEPRVEGNDRPGRGDPRWLRNRMLVGAAVMPGEIEMEDPGLLLLLAVESLLRGEELEAERVTSQTIHRKLGLIDSLRAIYGHLASLQRNFIAEGGDEELHLDPSGRKLAVNFSWYDGRERRSELRLFQLPRLLLFEAPTLEAVGPSRWWKELHDRHRRPEQVLPTLVAKNPGRFLAWNFDGSALVSQSSPDAVTIWRATSEGGETGVTAAPVEAPSVLLRGLMAPARGAAFSPSGRWLAVVDRDGRPYVAKLGRGARLRLLARRPPDGGVGHLLATERGLLTAGRHGTLRFWPFDGSRSFIVHQPAERARHFDSGPGQRWLLTGEQAAGRQEAGWGGMLLIPLRADFPGEPFAFGGGAFWRSASWSLDGRWLAVTRTEATELWRLQQRPELVLTVEHEGSVPVRFSPDSRRLQVGGEIWLLEGSPIPETRAFRGSDRPMLEAARDLSRRQLWRSFGLRRSPWRRRPVASRQGPHRTLVSADGRWLLATGAPWQLHVWHFGDPLLGSLAPPTGQTLTSLRRFHLPTSGPSAAELWPDVAFAALANAPENELVASVCRVAGRNLSAAEWQRYMGDEPYRETCVPSRRR